MTQGLGNANATSRFNSGLDFIKEENHNRDAPADSIPLSPQGDNDQSKDEKKGEKAPKTMKVSKDGVSFAPMPKGIRPSHRGSRTIKGKKDRELEEDGGDYGVADNYNERLMNRPNQRQGLPFGKKYSFGQAKTFGLKR